MKVILPATLLVTTFLYIVNYLFCDPFPEHLRVYQIYCLWLVLTRPNTPLSNKGTNTLYPGSRVESYLVMLTHKSDIKKLKQALG